MESEVKRMQMPDSTDDNMHLLTEENEAGSVSYTRVKKKMLELIVLSRVAQGAFRLPGRKKRCNVF